MPIEIYTDPTRAGVIAFGYILCVCLAAFKNVAQNAQQQIRKLEMLWAAHVCMSAEQKRKYVS